MNALRIIIVVVMAAALVYLTFINRNWPSHDFLRLLLLCAIAAIIGVVWMMIRSATAAKANQDGKSDRRE